MKKILFICWDGPYVNYLEGLFLPIFVGLKGRYEIHIVQFSWASSSKVSYLKQICEAQGINYVHYSTIRKPTPLLGSFITVLNGAKLIYRYIKDHKIDIIMPRSTLPAAMGLLVLRKVGKLKMAFDADGLPLEERVDFSGLNPKSIQYKILKFIESKAIDKADVVITRSIAAISYLSKDKPMLHHKFFKVTNGRDINFFKDKGGRNVIRRTICVPQDALILVYVGSLGPQYCVSEMFQIYREVCALRENCYLLILTGNTDYLESQMFSKLTDDYKNVISISIPFHEVPAYLAASDVALAIRQPTFSMKGVAPIKIGEYLLSRLPVVASSGIGDTELILHNEMSCFVLENNGEEALKYAANWIVEVYNKPSIKEEARALGIREFSLEKSINSYTIALSQLN